MGLHRRLKPCNYPRAFPVPRSAMPRLFWVMAQSDGKSSRFTLQGPFGRHPPPPQAGPSNLPRSPVPEAHAQINLDHGPFSWKILARSYLKDLLDRPPAPSHTDRTTLAHPSSRNAMPLSLKAAPSAQILCAMGKVARQQDFNSRSKFRPISQSRA